MPNTLKIKRGLASSIPQGQLAEPLFTTDTYDLYIGKGSGGNQRIQNYIASGTTNDILRGDGSVYTFPLGISSPSAGQVLKYNGTSWVNDSDAGITGTGTTNTLPKFTGATTLGNSNVTDSGSLITLGSNSYVNGALGIGTASPSYNIDVAPSSGSPVIRAVRSGGADVRLSASVTATGGIIGTYTSSPFLFYINGAEIGRFDTNGALGIGTTSLTEYSIRIQKGISGGAISYGISNEGAVANTVTNFAINYQSSAITALSTTLTNYVHYNANVSSFASSTITNLFGFRVNSSNIEGTNNYGFYGDIPSGTNRWNIYMNGTANNYLAGSLGIGTTSLTGYNLRVSKNLTGSTSTTGIQSAGAIQSDVTSDAQYFSSGASTAAAAFTVTDLAHFIANQGTFGAGSTVTKQYGFRVAASLTGATNNYAFFSDIASGNNRWNLYMNGTANNYMAGALGIGITSIGTNSLQINRSTTGAATANTLTIITSAASDVTNRLSVVTTNIGTDAASFTLGTLEHYRAQQGTFGVGSTVTTQVGFRANSNLTGATNNYGFQGSIPAQANAWNLYMDGTANNYLAGSLGIGTTSLTGYTLRLAKSVTGATNYYGIESAGTIQSDVTSSMQYFQSIATTQATTFTLGVLRHYFAFQGSFGAGSTVTSQIGYLAHESLIGATNNFGFYGNIPSGTNRWNLYMNGTAANYLNGSLGISATALTGITLGISKNITGATNSYGTISNGTVQSDVTSNVYNFNSSAQTAAAAFTLANYFHYAASQGLIGAGSAITTQTGFWVDSSFTAATNNRAFRGSIAAATNAWNLYMDGTANNYMAGSLGIGTTSVTGNNLIVNKNITGSTNPVGIYNAGTIQSDATGNVSMYATGAAVVASAFTVNNIFHYNSDQLTIGAGATVTTQVGFRANNTLVGAGTNYGFQGRIPAQANAWNLYMDGTANNYLAGSLGIGSTALSVYTLRLQKSITGGTSAYGVRQQGQVQSDVTTLAFGFWNTLSTAGAAFTLGSYVHFNINQDALGAGSSVTNQFGFSVDSTMIGAANNYAFYSNIAAGSGRWNLYMAGTAANYLAGNLSIGTTSSNGRLTIQPANDTVGISVSGSSLTGTNAQSLLDLSQTWNTTGYPTAIKLNITNTASGILSNLMDLQVGGATQFLVDKAGAIKTSAPSGGTAGKWKLGSKVTATVALVTTDYIELEVDGVAYKVGLVS